MKKIIKLIVLLIIFMGFKLDVYASSYSDQFYIAETIENIYYAKEKNNNIEYRKAKFKRRSSDNKIVYCIEPFVDLKEGTNYKGYDQNYENLLNLSLKKWERIRLLSYYGYGYDNHTEDKWYAITQIMIWKTIDEKAEFYWTNTFKGDKITQFTEEEKALEELVKNHSKKPSFDNLTFDMSINSNITINDGNRVLSNYKLIESENADVEISGNNVKFKSTGKEETINLEFVKKDNKYNTLPIVYVSDAYQNVLSVGGYEPIKANLTITVNSGTIKIIKQDKDNESIMPQGEASLVGTTYELLDINKKPVYEIIIGEDSTGIIEKVVYGRYTLREKISGKGYRLDNNEYQLNIKSNNRNVELILQDEVIKSKIKLYKYYQKEEEKKEMEEGIKFQVINNKGEIYKEVITDKNGYTEFELPYGTYTIKQINTTEGYYKVDDFTVTIDEKSEEVIEYHLNDLKVPDTYQEDNTYKTLILLTTITIGLIYILKYEKKVN